MSFLNNIDYNSETNKATINLEFGYDYIQQARTFFSVYKQEKILIIAGEGKSILKPKNERICRFCGNRHPDVKFKNKAHLIPQLLGNDNLISDFECDTCNKLFSRFENDFANFIGLSRTLSKMSGKEGVPKFKSPDMKFSTWVDEERRIRYSESENEKNVIFDLENNEIIFKTSSLAYRGLLVYKCLVKIGLSLLDDSEIEDYKSSIDFLKNNSIKKSDNSLCSIHQYIIPGPYSNFPVLMVFKKRESIKAEMIPTMTFVLYFRNIMIQYFVPYDIKDNKLNEPNSKIKVFLIPPLVNQEWIEKYGKPQSTVINLSDSEKEKNRTEKIVLKINNTDLA